MNLKEAILRYMNVLGVDEFYNQLSPEEQTNGRQKMIGCLHAIEDRLSVQSDQASRSLVDTIREREEINGRTHDVTDSSLVKSTRHCAQKVFSYYVDKLR